MSPDKVLCVDVDDTICLTINRDYPNSKPIEPVIEKLREAKAKGYRIILHTARGQGRSEGMWETVSDEVLAEIVAFCKRFSIPYDSIVLGKPWARWYIDDKALRPDEFVAVEL